MADGGFTLWASRSSAARRAVCGTTDSAGVLIAARLRQGVGSGMAITCSLAIVASYYDSHRRAWAIGIWSAFTMLISGLGPIIGGWLAEAGLWRMIFHREPAA